MSIFKKLQHLSREDHIAIWEMVNFGMDFTEYYCHKAEEQGGVYEDIYTTLMDQTQSIQEKIAWSDSRLAALYSRSSDEAYAFQSFSEQLRSLLKLEDALKEK